MWAAKCKSKDMERREEKEKDGIVRRRKDRKNKERGRNVW